MDKRRTVTYSLIGGVLVLAAWAASAMPRHHKPETLPNHDVDVKTDKQTAQALTVPKAPPRVEIVFALDTTGSMSGLIDGAKRKIWSIAQFVANGQPKPDVRIGLVAYRDVGDAYVTRFYDLDGDLDDVFERLSSFQAEGGGDTPEHVSKALYDAVYRTSWTGDQATLKQIYLVGDAPPHTDYHDGYDYLKIAKKARDLGIHINTIRCGSDSSTEQVWNQIAHTASGEYASIAEDGGVRVAVSPYDTKLQELNARLVDTAVGYGSGRGTLMRKAHAAKLMDASAAADRASFYGAGGGAVGAKDTGDDLVGLAEAGKVMPSAAPATALPPEMQAMSPAKRDEYVKGKIAERNAIQKQINDIAKSRREWLDKNAKGRDGFDAKVEGALKKQASSVGLKL
jgi:Mg-chelatase subunit ChlD